MNKLFFGVVALVLMFCGCASTGNQNAISTESVKMVESDSTIALPIDSRTKTYTFSLHYFENYDGGEFLSLENNEYDSKFGVIHYYSLDSLKLHHTVRINYEGNDAAPFFDGHTTLNFNEIMISCDNSGYMFKMDSLGRVLHMYHLYNDMYSEEDYEPNWFNSMEYNPLYCIDGKYYVSLQLPPADNYPLDDHIIDFSKRPLMLLVDTASGNLQCAELSFPKLYDKISGKAHLNNYSHIYDGKHFVFSFFGLDSLYVSDDLKTFKTFPAATRYATVKNTAYDRNLDVMEYTKLAQIRPRYGNIVYDRCREVYYRFCYMYDNVVADEDFSKRIHTNYLLCHGEFSIQVFDKDFNLLGETKFPRGKYAPMLFFVNKAGLWLSENNDERPDVDDDWLVFRCFNLVRNNAEISYAFPRTSDVASNF